MVISQNEEINTMTARVLEQTSIEDANYDKTINKIRGYRIWCPYPASLLDIFYRYASASRGRSVYIASHLFTRCPKVKAERSMATLADGRELEELRKQFAKAPLPP